MKSQILNILLIFSIIFLIITVIISIRKKDANTQDIMDDIFNKTIVVESYIYVECLSQFLHPNYNKNVNISFAPGSILDYNLVRTGRICIDQYLGIEKYNNKYYYQYKYSMYESLTNQTQNLININFYSKNINLDMISMTIKNETNINVDDIIQELKEYIDKEIKTHEEQEQINKICDDLINLLPFGSNCIILLKDLMTTSID